MRSTQPVSSYDQTEVQNKWGLGKQVSCPDDESLVDYLEGRLHGNEFSRKEWTTTDRLEMYSMLTNLN